jgi:exopolysaccharide/PEP-CTERM locus tyrosine autokinase
MSRIESALEKAALVRNGISNEGGATPVPDPAPSFRIESALEKVASGRTGMGKQRSAIPSPAPQPSFIDQQAQDAVKVTNPLLVAANDPHTFVAEEYRKLKSILVNLTNKDNFQNTLMVSSALSNEGKSITALNLAISLAQEHDHTVLLVDADLRKPSIQNYLGMPSTLGLSECITDGVDIGKALIRTGIGKLMLLPAGKQIRNPVEHFSSQRVKNLILELKHRYPDRYIIIDTPPVLPFTETRTLSTIVDGVVFVVKEGVASLSEINEAIGYLKEANLLGILYNEASSEDLAGRYHYY